MDELLSPNLKFKCKGREVTNHLLSHQAAQVLLLRMGHCHLRGRQKGGEEEVITVTDHIL